MKLFFKIPFILLFFSCSISKKTNADSVLVEEMSIKQDSSINVKPLMLNGKVVTPSPNNATIIP